MKPVATYEASVIHFDSPNPSLSIVWMKEVGTNKSVNTIIPTEKLIEKGIGPADNFLIEVYLDENNNPYGVFSKPTPPLNYEI